MRDDGGLFAGQNPVFIPGPTNMPDHLRHAMAVQTIDHRAPDFVNMLGPLLDGLKAVLKTERGSVVTFPASGTAGWEAAVTNTLSPGDTVLAARHGVFSHRWIDLCRRHGLNVVVIERPWGSGAPADIIGERLRADTDHTIKAVLVTHNETATGVLSDVGAVRKAMDEAGHPALLCVDGVSSIASMDFRMDEWGVDLAVTGSQKGFMLATGMAIVGVSERAAAAMETARCARAYLDMRDMLAATDQGSFPYTPPLQIMAGLKASVDLLLAEGLDNVFARHRRIADGVRAAVNAWGLNMVATSPDLYSDTVTAILVPEGMDAEALTEHAYRAYGVSYGIGLGKMAGKAFRIGHLGAMTETMALSGIATIEMAMKDLSYPIALGSGVAAAQASYRTGARGPASLAA
ncbi:MAG: L-aspartate--glyoxylate aminotransferase BhcA [Pseudomonadota bacterium]